MRLLLVIDSILFEVIVRFPFVFALLAAALIFPQPSMSAPPMQQCKASFQKRLKPSVSLLRMRLRPGESCRFAIPYRRGTTIEEIRLIEKPRTGRVTAIRRSGFVYKAPRSGTDFFAVAFVGRSHTVKKGGGALVFNVEVK